MILWDMNSGKRTLTAVLSDEQNDQLGLAMAHAGTDPVKVRKAFHAAGASPLKLQLMEEHKRTVETRRQVISDILLYYTMQIFSPRGKALAMRLGSVEEDFWPCRFDTNPDETFFLILPNRTFDIVDPSKSVFSRFVSIDPPIPSAIGTLAFNRPPQGLPPLFHTRIPNTQAFFCGLLVRDDFKAAWEQAKFTGATFRRLC